MTPTKAWYAAHAASFAEATRGVDMSALREPFLALLPPGAWVLDAGCGSGRDSLVFLRRGHRVVALEPCEELAALAERLVGQPVLRQRLEEIDAEAAYDGVWACASLLHVPASDTPDALARLARALRPGGVLYASYKLGSGEREQGGRFFHDQTETSLRRLLESVSLSVQRVWTTDDARPDVDQRWVNALARRRG